MGAASRDVDGVTPPVADPQQSPLEERVDVVALGDSSWMYMQEDQAYTVETESGGSKQVSIKTACTPSGSIVKPSMSQRASYEILLDLLGREPDERAVRFLNSLCGKTAAWKRIDQAWTATGNSSMRCTTGTR